MVSFERREEKSMFVHISGSQSFSPRGSLSYILKTCGAASHKIQSEDQRKN